MARTPSQPLVTEFHGFANGAGAFDHADGYYAIALNADCRWGPAIPGPREVVDLTGIATGFRVRKFERHNDVQCLLTTDGTDTKIYRRQSGAWALKTTFSGAVGTDLVSFNDGTNSTLIAFLGASTAFQYSTDDGATWTASTKSGNAKYGNLGMVQMNGLAAPRVVYVRNPNQIYYSTNMANTGNVTTSSSVGDFSAQTYFTSLTEDDTGMVLCGMRNSLFAFDGVNSIRIAGPFPDPPADAGGQSDRNNFEAVATVNGRIYYNFSGYEIGEWFHGQWNAYMAPKWSGPLIPRMDLPVNAMAAVHGWLVVALGSKNTATIKAATYSPGGSALVQNSFGVTSELWAGRYQVNPATGSMGFVWHGILLQCTDPLRYMWYDEDESYLYLASGDAESADLQQRRCLWYSVAPQFHALSSVVTLQTGAWEVESGRIMNGDAYVVKRFVSLEAAPLGCDSATPTLEVLYRAVQEYETTAYTSLVTWYDSHNSRRGVRFPYHQSYRSGRIKFKGTGNAGSNAYAVLLNARVFSERYEPLAVNLK